MLTHKFNNLYDELLTELGAHTTAQSRGDLGAAIASQVRLLDIRHKLALERKHMV